MTDLIARLRTMSATGWHPIGAEAANEIDRLTRELDEARAERDAMRILVESTCHALHRAGVTSANAPDDPGEAIDIIVAERDALANVLPGHYYMDPPDGGDVPVLEQLRRMAKDAERYRTMKAHIADLLEICALAGTCTDDAPDIFAGLDPSRLDLAMDRLALAQIEQERSEQAKEQE